MRKNKGFKSESELALRSQIKQAVKDKDEETLYHQIKKEQRTTGIAILCVGLYCVLILAAVSFLLSVQIHQQTENADEWKTYGKVVSRELCLQKGLGVFQKGADIPGVRVFITCEKGNIMMEHES